MQLRVSQATFLCWQDTVPTTQNKSQGLWELHNPLTTGWKSCWLLYPSKVKANNKPSWHFFPCLLLWLLHSTQRKTLGDISQWSVDDMTIYLWFFFFFFSLQVNTGFIQEKKITGWIKVLRLADKHLGGPTGWPKWSHIALTWTYCILSTLPFIWWPLLFLRWSNDACSHQSTFHPPNCFHIFPTSSLRSCNLDHFHWALHLTFQTYFHGL